MENKVFLIGLDGATWPLLNRILKQGYMPFLDQLRREGKQATLQSSLPPDTPPAWSLFHTGIKPWKMGIHGFWFWDKESKELGLIDSLSLRKCFWEYVGEKGMKVGLISLPVTFPPKKVNGYLVSGLLTPSAQSNFTFPESLKREILKSIPDFEILNVQAIEFFKQQQNVKKLLKAMARHIEFQKEITKIILKKDKIDLLMVQFQANDIIQHALWHLFDPQSPAYSPKKETAIFSEFYSQLDKQIEEIWRLFKKKNRGKKFTTFVISDHGFQARKKIFYLGNWLVKNNFLVLSRKGKISSFHISFMQKCPSLLKLAKKLTFSSKKLSQVVISSRLDIKEEISWEKTNVFCPGGDLWAFVYLLSPQVENKLVKKIREIKDPDNGKRIVKKLIRTRRYFGKDLPPYYPEILIRVKDGYALEGKIYPGKPDFESVSTFSGRTGYHHEDGILIISGSQKRVTKKDYFSLADIPPSILALLGIDIPHYFDGKSFFQ